MHLSKNNTLPIGYKIKAFREANHLTQEHLAELMKCSFKTIGNIENDRVVPDLRQIINLCDILNVSMDELFSGVLAHKNISPQDEQQKKLLAEEEAIKTDAAFSKNTRKKIETIYMKIRNMSEKEIALIEDVVEAVIKNR
ncbi:MAG: helix-turn-helix transcriptional regulator [Alphaproteobacteria bacterium]|nr:helix-turn-helix transcriptional regulator [Alphaproteobacteria bacterium]